MVYESMHEQPVCTITVAVTPFGTSRLSTLVLFNKPIGDPQDTKITVLPTTTAQTQIISSPPPDLDLDLF